MGKSVNAMHAVIRVSERHRLARFNLISLSYLKRKWKLNVSGEHILLSLRRDARIYVNSHQNRKILPQLGATVFISSTTTSGDYLQFVYQIFERLSTIRIAQLSATIYNASIPTSSDYLQSVYHNFKRLSTMRLQNLERLSTINSSTTTSSNYLQYV